MSFLSGYAGRFVFSSESSLRGVASWGQVYSYSGGGHVVELPHLHNSTKGDMRNLCLDLQRDRFIDGATRAVFFEVVLLSPSEDHFAVVSLVSVLSLALDAVTLLTRLRRPWCSYWNSLSPVRSYHPAM